MFNGVKIFELVIPKSKKTNEIINDQYLISFAFSNGQIAIIKKTIEKTIPKLLLVDLFLIFI